MKYFLKFLFIFLFVSPISPISPIYPFSLSSLSSFLISNNNNSFNYNMNNTKKIKYFTRSYEL